MITQKYILNKNNCSFTKILGKKGKNIFLPNVGFEIKLSFPSFPKPLSPFFKKNLGSIFAFATQNQKYKKFFCFTNFCTFENKNRQSGQVLVVGIIIILALMLCILILFDVHNIMRAKFKLETAQESAALTAANWQKESLNLIGEINLIKLASSIMEDDSLWDNTDQLANINDENEDEKNDIIRQRLAILSEMQTRISFIGPIIGFAAAQQAAKANGLNPTGDLTNHIENELKISQRYDIETINNYYWKTPYINLLSSINVDGIAVYPNTRAKGTPSTSPTELSSESLYNEIVIHQDEVYRKGDVTKQTPWNGLIYTFVKNWRQEDFKGKWWDIFFEHIMFPMESEIYTLGVNYGGTVGKYNDVDYSQYYKEIVKQAKSKRVYKAEELPWVINLCCYDDFWFPQYYDKTFSDYSQNHYDYWYNGGILRKNLKKAYIYEGAAAYAEGMVKVDSVNNIAVNKTSSWKNKNVVYKTSRKRTTLGSSGSTVNANRLSNARSGVIAKVFGELSDNNAPIEIPLVLPVFNNVSIVPTFMPQPNTFAILRGETTLLEKFLSFLAAEEDIFNTKENPPSGTEWMLYALQMLTFGAEFRYYGYNPDFDANSFDRKIVLDPKSIIDNTSYFYSYPNNTSGAGWLQQAQLFYDGEKKSGEKGAVVEVQDIQNGGTATRIYLEYSTENYYVIDSNAHVITNDEVDPTRTYYTSGGGSGSGNGFGGGGSSADTNKGPSRL